MAYCLRLSKDVAELIDDMRRHWLDFEGVRAAGGTPSARALRQYAWQFWPEGFGNSGEQGIWRIVALNPRRDYILRNYHGKPGDPWWKRVERCSEVYPPPPIDPECGDADDVARFSYAAWVDEIDKYECDPPWMRYPRSR